MGLSGCGSGHARFGRSTLRNATPAKSRSGPRSLGFISKSKTDHAEMKLLRCFSVNLVIFHSLTNEATLLICYMAFPETCKRSSLLGTGPRCLATETL